MKRLLLLTLFILLFAGCGKRKARMEQAAGNDTEIVFADGHNARNSLDWFGTYKGILPGVDCDSVEVTVILKEGDNYILRRKCLDNSNITYQSQGSFVWDGNGQTITVFGPDGTPYKFDVIENAIVSMGFEGHRKKSEKPERHVLKKL